MVFKLLFNNSENNNVRTIWNQSSEESVIILYKIFRDS